MEIQKNHLLILAENQRIETPRLWLRPVTMADANDLFEYASDEETTEFVFPRHQSIEEKMSGNMIGTIDLRVDPLKEVAELGYTLNKAFWGQGIVPEAARMLLSLGFEKLALVRIYALHDQRNHRSGRVMEKIGMKVEAQIPAARRFRGQVVDEVMRGITRDEWQKRIM